MGKHIITIIKEIFMELVENIKGIRNISFMPIWMEPFGHMTKQQEAEIMKLVREEKRKAKQKKKQKKSNQNSIK